MTNAQNVMTAIRAAYKSANLAWAKRPAGARDSQATRDLKATILAGTDEVQGDVASGLKTFEGFTAVQMSNLAALGVDWAAVANGITNATNVKVARRLPQLLGFIVSGNPIYLQGSAKTALVEYSSLLIGAKTKNALRFASTGKGDESTSDEITVSRARKLQKAFGKVSANSRDTQASVSFSKGGLLEILGIAGSWSRGSGVGNMPTIRDSELSRKLTTLIAGASDQTIELWANKKA